MNEESLCCSGVDRACSRKYNRNKERERYAIACDDVAQGDVLKTTRDAAFYGPAAYLNAGVLSVPREQVTRTSGVIKFPSLHFPEATRERDYVTAEQSNTDSS